MAYPLVMLVFIVETIIFQEILGLTLKIFYFGYAVATGLAIAAVVSGSIDLKRIKAGRYSNKGMGLDIAGIVMGGIPLLIISLFGL